MKTTNILLIGHFGFVNRGCEAIVRGTVEIIKKYIPSSTITLCSKFAPEDKKNVKETNILIDKVISSNEGAKKFTFPWFWQTFDRRVLNLNISFQDYLQKKYYKSNELVLSIGGDNFSEDYGEPDTFFDSLRYAKEFGAKTVIWGASIGPFKNENISKWARVMKTVDLITVRESITEQYLQKNSIADNVRRVADPAFLLPCVKPSDWHKSAESSKITVGIGMSDLITRYGISEETYLKIFTDFIQYLLRKKDIDIILVPHVVDTHFNGADDASVCERLMKMVSENAHLHVISPQYNACEMKYCISQCRYFIGARTHSTIASLSTMVPTISIGYSTKAWGINNDLLGSDEYVLSIKDLTCEKLIEKFDKLCKNETKIKEHLKKKLPWVQNLSYQAGEELAKLI